MTIVAEREKSPTMSVAGKTILYTGAAGGLGHDTTLHFLRRGARVVAIDNNFEKVEELKADVVREGLDQLVVQQTDMADLDELRGRLDETLAKIGGFDVVINNAALYPSKSFEDYSIEEQQKVQRVNVDAGIVCVQAALPGMRKNKWGRIINIASITFYGGWAKLSPYVQSKGALLGLTHGWAREFGPYGITVNALSPGAFPTDAEKIHPDPEGYSRFVLDHQAVKRRGQPVDVAYALTFFASEASGFITGQTLNVDGGWVMR